MTDPKKKGKYIGMLGAVLVHGAFIVFLFLMGFTLPEPQEESGVPVMLGDVPQASGWSDPSLVEVETMPAEAVVPQESVEQELLTQDLEETVTLTPESKKEAEVPEKTEAEKAEEARRLAEERAERERREAEEAARRRVAGAFGKGSKMGSRGDAATGEQCGDGCLYGCGRLWRVQSGGTLHRGRRIATPGVQRAGRGTCGGDHHRESGRACDCHRNQQTN